MLRPARECIPALSLDDQRRPRYCTSGKLAGQRANPGPNRIDNVPFSMGIVQGDAEKARFAWGVKSLPWLILTDKSHVVSAEGFAVSELQQQIIK